MAGCEGVDRNFRETSCSQDSPSFEAGERHLIRGDSEQRFSGSEIELESHLRVQEIGLGEDDTSTRTEHPESLPQSCLEVKVMKHRASIHGVEDLRRKRQLLGVTAEQPEAK